ncbi:MAG TPA: excinuclease ABC subunit UvrC, partial [Gammaproteobacteria bacterium]|nr:excinuclease ABC subunit UvrC [Gammaproteobacteria bacterium]
MSVMIDAKSFLKNLPSLPGVYVMRDAKSNTLYIGKAKNLKRRVASYFRAQSSTRLQILVSKIHDIEITVTHSEKEALLLENALIKSLMPRYNIFLKDDKSYPYLFLSKHSQYPQLTYHRGPQTLPGRYFGPYPSALAVKETLKLLQKIFKLRQCVDNFFKNRSRPCLQYQIQRCSAPCVGYITQEEYQADVQHVVQFLLGKEHGVIEDLVEKMNVASHVKDYERAAKYRDQIVSLKNIQDEQVVVGRQGNVDVLAISLRAEFALVQALMIREGRILGARSYSPTVPKGGVTGSELMEAFLGQFYINYASSRDFPSEIIISHPFEDMPVFAQALEEVAQKPIKITTKVRGIRSKWLNMAKENAQKSLEMRLGRLSTLYQRFCDLQKVLNLSQPIRRMECFDISHFQGEATVASCVVFDERGPQKSEYRHYNIENAGAGDDYAAMEEALLRRYSKLKQEDRPIPDILLIDGG